VVVVSVLLLVVSNDGSSLLEMACNYLYHSTSFQKMTPDTLNFSGDATTFLGLIGVVSTLVILVSVFRSYYNSPYRK